MKKLTLIFALAILAISFTGCEKDDEKPSNMGMLTAKTWKMTGYRVDPAIDLFGTGVLISNIYNQRNCFHDDTMKFNASGTFTMDEGANKCQDIQTSTGTWTFNPTETIITITSDGETISGQLLELTSSSLKFRYTIPWGDLTLTFDEEYTAQ
jgi:hypothetical protein